MAMVDDPPTPLITDWIPPNPAVLRKMVSRSWNDTPDVGDWNAIAEKMLTPWLKNEYEPIPQPWKPVPRGVTSTAG